MKKRFILVLTSLLLVLLLLAPTACVPKKNSDDKAPVTIEQLQARIVSLESKAASQAKLVATLQSQGSGNLKPLIDQLKADLASANTKISELEVKVGELSVEAEEENTSSLSDTVRWNFTGERITYPPTVSSNITVAINDIDPRRIEDEGLYEIELYIVNHSNDIPFSMTDIELELILEPRDYTSVNQDETYLDSDDSPWLSWDTDFVMKTREGEEVCRRIEFTSDRYNFNTTLAPNSYYKLDLVLELYLD